MSCVWRRVRRSSPALIAAGLALGGCRDDPVSPGAVASLLITPDSATVVTGVSAPFIAIPRDADGIPLAGRWVTWYTLDPDIASVTTSGAVRGLKPGRARIIASSGGKLDTGIARVIPPREFNITAVQFTQSVQAADGSIPIVLNGNGVAVNVLVSSTTTAISPMQVVLRLLDGANKVVRADTAQITGALPATPSMLTPTIQFRLPASALVPPVRWQVVRDPGGVVPDENAATDVFPRAGPAALTTVGVPPIAIRFVPIVLTSHNNTTGDVTQPLLAEYLRTVRSVHPLGAVTATVGTPFTTDVSFGTPPEGGDPSAFWSPVLAQLDLARINDADPTVHWVGVVRPPPGFETILSGGIAYVPLLGGSSGAGTRTALVTTVNWESNPAYARETAAHELGHNFGRRHAPCGGAPNADPSYPHAGGLIGVPGFDVRGWMEGRASTAALMPPTTGDIMSYCYPVAWVSDYTYRGVMDFRSTIVAGSAATASALASPVTRSLIVRGSVVRGRGVTLEPAMALDVRATRPERTGRYRLEGRTADGRTLFAYDFEPGEIDHANDVRHFAFAIPVTRALEDAIATIEVRGPAGSARLDRPPPSAALRRADPLPPQRMAGGMTRVACGDASARGIAVRNAATGALLGASRGAVIQVRAAAGTQLEVVCSDGVASSSATVTAR